jgi:hypothetical protein
VIVKPFAARLRWSRKPCAERACGPGDWLGWSAEVHDAKARRLRRFAPEVDDEAAKPMTIRDRIKELRRVRASDLVPNPKNWRRHQRAQAEALDGLLAEIGYADALLARELPDGRLMTIDGHLRAETTPRMEHPVLVLDVTEEEAAKILLTIDPLAAMAEGDQVAVEALLETVRTNSRAIASLLERIAGENAWHTLNDLAEIVEVPAQIDRAPN